MFLQLTRSRTLPIKYGYEYDPDIVKRDKPAFTIIVQSGSNYNEAIFLVLIPVAAFGAQSFLNFKGVVCDCVRRMVFKTILNVINEVHIFFCCPSIVSL